MRGDAVGEMAFTKDQSLVPSIHSSGLHPPVTPARGPFLWPLRANVRTHMHINKKVDLKGD